MFFLRKGIRCHALFRNSSYFYMHNWLLFKDNGETFYELPRLTKNFLIKKKQNSLLVKVAFIIINLNKIEKVRQVVFY